MIKQIFTIFLLQFILLNAASKNNPEFDTLVEIEAQSRFQKYLEERLESLFKEGDYNKLLLDASECGNIEFAKKAIDYGADVNTQSEIGIKFRALHLACSSRGNVELVKLLMQYKADKDAKSDFLYTPLMVAVSEGQYETVKFLLEIKADKNSKPPREYSLLNFAISNEHKNNEYQKIVKMLVNEGLDVNQGQGNLKPLKMAIKKSSNLVPILLKFGASIDNIKGEINQSEIFSMAITMKVYNINNSDSRYFIFDTITNKIDEINNTIKNNLQCLENRKNNLAWHVWQKITGKSITYCNINFIDDNGMTALMWASCRDNEKIVEILLDYGRKTGLLNVAYENNEHETALVLAQRRGHKKIAKDIYDYLLQHRINLAKLFRTKKLPLRVGSYLAEFIYGGNILKE